MQVVMPSLLHKCEDAKFFTNHDVCVFEPVVVSDWYPVFRRQTLNGGWRHVGGDNVNTRQFIRAFERCGRQGFCNCAVWKQHTTYATPSHVFHDFIQVQLLPEKLYMENLKLPPLRLNDNIHHGYFTTKVFYSIVLFVLLFNDNLSK